MPDVQLNAKSLVTTSATTAPSAGTSETWTVTALGAGIPTLAGPNTYTLVDATIGATAGQQAEIVRVTAATAGGTSITVTRGSDGTTPVAHANPSTFNLVLVAKVIDEIKTQYAPSGGQQGLAAWYAALAANDTAAAKVLVIGDSTDEGSGASTWANRYVSKLETLLREARQLPRQGAGYIPALSVAAPSPPRNIVLGSGTATNFFTGTSSGGLGIKSLGLKGNGSGGSGARLNWGSIYCDRIRIWYSQPDSFAQDGTVFLDGVSVATLTGSNTPWRGGQVWDSGALTAGYHTVEVRGGDSFDFMLDAGEFFLTDYGKGVHVYDGAHFGFATGDFIGAGPDRGFWKGVLTLKPQLVTVSLGINDIYLGVTPATYLANIDTILANIATANAGIDYSVLLVGQFTPSRTSQNDANWLAYKDGLRARQSHNVAFLDLNASWPVLAADGSMNKGLMAESPNPLHPSDAGHDLYAHIVARALTVQTRDKPDSYSPDENLTTEHTATQPPRPTTGVTQFARNRARPTTAFLDKYGHDTQLQPNLYSNAVRFVTTGDGLAATLLAHRCAVTSVGTLSEATVATTNFRTMLSRTLFTTSSTAGNAGGTRIAKAFLQLNTTADRGGFHYCTRVAVETPQTGSRAFFGLCATTTALAGTSDTSALVNMIGFGWDAADTQMQFMVNDGSGTATKTSITPAAFSKNGTGVTGAFWELHIYSPPGGGFGNALVVYWYARELSTGAEQAGTVTTTNLPATATLLAPHVHFTNGSTAAVAALAFQSLYLETDN